MQININDVKHINDEEYLFRDLNIVVDSKVNVGIIGDNGCGKTTILKNIYEKEIMLYFPLEFNAEIDVESCITQYVDVLTWEILVEFSKIKLNSNVLYKTICDISEGEKRKVMLVIMFLSSKFKLLDEITNHLDIETRKHIVDYLSKKNGFLIVSHDREVLTKCVDKIIAIENSGVKVYNGNLTIYEEEYDKRINHEKKISQKLNKDISRLNKSAKKRSDNAIKAESSKNGIKKNGEKVADRGFVSHRAAKVMKSSKNIQRREQEELELKKCLLKDLNERNDLKLKSEIKLDKKIYLTGFVENKSFELKQGNRYYIIGKNGCGKTTLLNHIYNCKSDYKISYVKQEPEINNIYFGDIETDNHQLFISMLISLGFTRDLFKKKLDSFSSGQIKKIFLVKSLVDESDFIIWDEPYNYLDLRSKKQIFDLISSSEKTMLIVTHEQSLVENNVFKLD